jgi:hypothetical protein
VDDDIEQAHEVMRTHLPPDGQVWCNVCGERNPCATRRDARSLLIRAGHLVLTNSAPRR